MIHLVAAAALSLCLLSLSANALSAQWVLLGADARGNAWHLNADSVTHEHHKVTAWKRIEFKPPYPQFEKGLRFRWAFVLNVIDCIERRAHVKAISLLDADGAVIAVQEDGGVDSHWPSTRVPLMDTAMALACSHAGKAGREH